MSESARRGRGEPGQRARILVEGRVQGVGFRAFVLREAHHHPVAGWVRNRDDGRVEAMVEGPREAIEALAERLRVGSTFSRVARVNVEWEPWVGDLQNFEVLR